MINGRQIYEEVHAGMQEKARQLWEREPTSIPIICFRCKVAGGSKTVKWSEGKSTTLLEEGWDMYSDPMEMAFWPCCGKCLHEIWRKYF